MVHSCCSNSFVPAVLLACHKIPHIPFFFLMKSLVVSYTLLLKMDTINYFNDFFFTFIPVHSCLFRMILKCVMINRLKPCHMYTFLLFKVAVVKHLYKWLTLKKVPNLKSDPKWVVGTWIMKQASSKIPSVSIEILR